MTTSPPQEAERDEIRVFVKADLKLALKLASVTRGTTMAALVEEALTEFLERK